eukprot:3917-Hanusia_phi.AAC.1
MAPPTRRRHVAPNMASHRRQREAGVSSIENRRAMETKFHQWEQSTPDIVADGVPEYITEPLHVNFAVSHDKESREISWQDERLNISVVLSPGIGVFYSDHENGTRRLGVIKRGTSSTQLEVYIVYDAVLLKSVTSNLISKHIPSKQ